MESGVSFWSFCSQGNSLETYSDLCGPEGQVLFFWCHFAVCFFTPLPPVPRCCCFHVCWLSDHLSVLQQMSYKSFLLTTSLSLFLVCSLFFFMWFNFQIQFNLIYTASVTFEVVSRRFAETQNQQTSNSCSKKLHFSKKKPPSVPACLPC